jgi:stage V sporulation protein G
MQLTEVRISLCGESAGRLRAYCSLTFDDTFVIRDVKLIEGNDGLFLAMPSRKLCDRCDRCGEKNHLRARFCNHCGKRLNENRHMAAWTHGNGSGHGHGGHVNGNTHGPARAKLHADIAHPIHPECRHAIEQQVLKAYDEELHRASQPGYVPQRIDDPDAGIYDAHPLEPDGSGLRPSAALPH